MSRKTAVTFAAGLLLIALSGCSRTYPYLFLTDNCHCREYVYRDPGRRFDVVFRAEYEVDERVITTVEIEFINHSTDTLSLQQAFIKGSSRNIRYQYNDRWVPLPYETIAPRLSFTAVFLGGDSEIVSDPWLKIAGERTVLEVRGLMLGGRPLDPIRVELMPVNPKLSS